MREQSDMGPQNKKGGIHGTRRTNTTTTEGTYAGHRDTGQLCTGTQHIKTSHGRPGHGTQAAID